MNLAAAELELSELEHREARLKNALAQLRAEYDFIFIDCPPSLGLVTANALCAADSLLVLFSLNITLSRDFHSL